MYNNNNKSYRRQNQIAQQPPHQQQRTWDQHEAQTQGNFAKLVAEEFATLGKI